MNEYFELIKAIIPDFKDEHISELFTNAGVDSMDLVALRVDFERHVSKTIPDKDWLGFSTFYEVIQYCIQIKNGNGVLNNLNSNVLFEKELVINMPQMSIESLSENWLFKELGNNHWELLCKGLGTNSGDLQDELGNRLYATFVRIRIQSKHSLNDFHENEKMKMSGTISRFGSGMYFSKFTFQSIADKEKIIKANLMTSFSIRKSVGNKELVKSQPNITENHITNLDENPKFGNEYRLVKKQVLKQIEFDNHEFDITDEILFQTEYNLNPYYDLNGAGLLYFAAYPIIGDNCEARYFNVKEKEDTSRWEQSFFTASRDILYYANCDLNETIIYKLNAYDFINDNVIKTSSSLYRKSDNQLMARIYTVKNKRV